MKKFSLPLLVFSLFVLVSCNHYPGKWENLFTGKDLDKWKSIQNPESFKIEAGILVCSGQTGKLFYNPGKSFRNFEMEAELKTAISGISAILFHTSVSQPDSVPKGYMVMINNSAPEITEKGWTVKTGSISGVRSIYYPMVGNDEWFMLFIRVVENHIEIFINGVKVTDYIQPEHPWRGINNKERIIGEGTFAIEVISGETKIKMLRVKELPESEKIVPAIDGSWDTKVTRLAEKGFPLIDFHVHLKGGLKVDEAIANSRRLGINYGIAPNCGLRFPVTDDVSLSAYMDTVKGKPIFRGMQAEGREWITLFSPEAIAKFDYVFTDALTFTDAKGRRNRLWMPKEVWVEDKQQFMEQLTGKIEAIFSHEPVDIYVNPTLLPAELMSEYDQLWTGKRIERVIRVLARNNIALDINARYKVPGAAIIRMAKEAGLKFTFGTNNASADLGQLEYCLQMMDECGLTPQDMFMPHEHIQKPVLVKGLPDKITG